MMIIKVIKEVDVKLKVGSLLRYTKDKEKFFTKGKMYPVISVTEEDVEVIDNDRLYTGSHSLRKEFLQNNFELVQE